MRITNKIIQDRLLRNLQKSKERITNSQERISTSKNIKRASDDPIGFMRIMSYRRDIYRLRQTVRNAENASMTLIQMDSALEHTGDVLLEAMSEVTRVSSDTVGADERAAIAKDVQYMIDDILQKANTKYGGQYLFAGHKIFTQPYQEVGGVIDYVGDQGLIEQRVELNGSMVINTPGSEAFGTSASGIFKILTDLKNALEANNLTGIQDSIALIDAEIDRITAVRSSVGVKIKRVETSISELNAIEPELIDDLSKVEDIDIVIESGEYLAAQEAYQAALETTSSALQLPLLSNYLR